MYKRTEFNNETLLCEQQRCRSDHLVMNTEKVNKVALSNRDDKRLQTFDGVTTYPIGMNAFSVCASEMKIAIKNKFKRAVDGNVLPEQLKDIAIPLHYQIDK